MNRIFSAIAVVVTAGFVTLVAVAEDKAKRKAVELVDANPPANMVGRSNRVVADKIVDVKVWFEEINPPNLVVEATCEVPTGGYKEPMLNRVVYVKPPEDGIQDYYFTIRTPAAGTLLTQVISTHAASDTWTAYPNWVKGVRIHGVGNGVKTYTFK